MTNREQIIKAFEICRDQDLCNECPYEENIDCLRLKEKHAIELMKSQGQKIEELTEENERLNTSCTELARCCTKLETLYNIECKRVDTVKADTVRKMQERLKSYFEEDVKYDGFRIAIWIDQIAKEMLEGATHTNNANTCICCGEIIPEGTLTCPNCNEEDGK